MSCIEKLKKSINEKYGFYITEYFHNHLVTILENYDTEKTGIENICNAALSNLSLLEKIYENLTVNETFFFRHQEQNEFIIKNIIPKLLSENKTINILSAGCSYGCEAYSLMILINEYFKDMSDKINITGMDIDSQSIKIASEGAYTKWQTRKLNSNLLNKYFIKKSDIFYIKDKYKKIKFQKANILELKGSNNYHIILCRNVLIYFNDENIKKTLNNLINHYLNDKGYLFVAPGEFALLQRFGFQIHSDMDVTYFCKAGNLNPQRNNTVSPNIANKKFSFDLQKTFHSLLMQKKYESAKNLLKNIEKDIQKESQSNKELKLSKIKLLIAENKINEISESDLNELSNDEKFFILGLKNYINKDYTQALDYFRKASYLKDDLIYNYFQAATLFNLNDLINARKIFTNINSFTKIESCFYDIFDEQILKKSAVSFFSALQRRLQ
ncbi:hypothetical protein DSN97_08650 [Deferribacteraceae bacterium V6Fe1]|nr:hypothetical protein DSN97_08650 [Deferribacteraceae bacterium V6Fe1]